MRKERKREKNNKIKRKEKGWKERGKGKENGGGEGRGDRNQKALCAQPSLICPCKPLSGQWEEAQASLYPRHLSLRGRQAPWSLHLPWQPGWHSLPSVPPTAGAEKGLAVDHPRRAPESSLPAHRPADFCLHSNTHRSRGQQPGWAPHAAQLCFGEGG